MNDFSGVFFILYKVIQWGEIDPLASRLWLTRTGPMATSVTPMLLVSGAYLHAKMYLDFMDVAAGKSIDCTKSIN